MMTSSASVCASATMRPFWSTMQGAADQSGAILVARLCDRDRPRSRSCRRWPESRALNEVRSAASSVAPPWT